MRKIKLKKITIENFKGRTMSLDFSDRTVIRGTNKAGKTTLANAFFWLLIGTDCADRTNHKLYDTTKEFTHENAVMSVVEGVFDIDGTEVILKKTAKQKWVRPRGKSEYVKDKSDEYMFYVDGLAVSANTYKEMVEARFAPIDKMKLMLNVRYYQMLDWKKLRKHFSDMVGIISDSELQGDYSAIRPLLEKYKTTDVAKEALRQQINPLKKDLESIDAKIDGAKSMLPALDGVDEAEREIDEARKRLAEIDREIAGIGESNKSFVEKRKAEEAAIEQKKKEMEAERAAWDEMQMEDVKRIKKEIEKLNENNALIRKGNELFQNKKSELESQAEMARQQVQFLQEELDRLRKENADIKSRTFDENQVCELCGQPLPYDRIAELKAAFNERRENEHKSCVERGIRVKNNLAKQKEQLTQLETLLAELEKPQKVMSDEYLQIELANAEASVQPFEDSQLYGIMQKQLETMESALTVVPEANFDSLVEEKEALNGKIADLQLVTFSRRKYDSDMQRIAEMERSRAEGGIELARLEGLFFKCVEREREWASIVRDRANKFLSFAHVEMTELSKAGEINDICTLTCSQVDSDTTNTAEQVLIGVDVAQAFQRNADVSLPIFIDNAEQIVDSNLPAVDGQLVLMYVDEDYKELTIV